MAIVRFVVISVHPTVACMQGRSEWVSVVTNNSADVGKLKARRQIDNVAAVTAAVCDARVRRQLGGKRMHGIYRHVFLSH